jgi:flagellar hook-length control protein FliK
MGAGVASPGMSPGVVSAAASTQPRQSADAAGSAGAPTAPSPGVVPVLPALVPPLTVPTISAAGQATPPWLPAAVHEQVFTAVSPLLRANDGSYRIQLQLRPHDLGAVQVIVNVRHGEISIQMHAPDAAARDALRGGMSDLRQQLEDQGLRAGSMEVGSGGANARQPETPWVRPQVNETNRRGPIPSDLPVATAGAASSTALDLRM